MGRRLDIAPPTDQIVDDVPDPRKWLSPSLAKRAAGGVFLFFLAKGLLWLLVPALLALWALR